MFVVVDLVSLKLLEFYFQDTGLEQASWVSKKRGHQLYTDSLDSS